MESSADQARRVIHANDVDGLKRLLAEDPALLSWRGDDRDTGGLLGIATGAYSDSFEPERERVFTRSACAELLIDAGAVVLPPVCDGIIDSRARGLLQLFQRKGLLPRTLKFSAALGDIEAVRGALGESGNDPAALNTAFLCACRFEHEAVASFLLERTIALDPELGDHVAGSGGRIAFIKSLIENRSQYHVAHDTSAGPWQLFLWQQAMRAIDGDLTAFASWLRREPWLLDETSVGFQAELIERATLHDRAECIIALLDLDPAILRRQPPPPSQAIEFALTYERTHLVPLLTRIWPLPDDLPHAAGMGDLLRVKRWFDASGAPALGDLDNHYPYNDARARENLQWNPGTLQQILDTALAFAVINRHFDVADFLLEHGADINTNWNSHQPASILHELVFHENYDSMRFLIDRGIDMTITDYCWNSTAQGWARYGKNDPKMAQWLEEAEQQRNVRR